MAERSGFTVLPAVDISAGRCVRPLQGWFGTEAVYSDDPIDVALGLARAGARRLHVVDLDGARTGRPANRELLLETVRRAPRPVHAGGGMATIDDVEEVLAAGASRAVLGSRALEDPAALARACDRYGARIAVSLEARRDGRSPRAWKVAVGVPVLEAVRLLEDAGVTLFVYTDVSRDGAMSGPDVEGLVLVASAATCPVLASGGVSSLNDVRAVAHLAPRGIAGVVVGRALYEGKFSVANANRVADEARSGASRE